MHVFFKILGTLKNLKSHHFSFTHIKEAKEIMEEGNDLQ